MCRRRMCENGKGFANDSRIENSVLSLTVDQIQKICYTFSNYKDVMAKMCENVPVIAINEICPSEISII